MIHADRTSPAVLLHEGTINERLGCALRQPPIATSNLYTGKAQLTCHALRHQVSCRVNNEVPVVGNTLTNGNVLCAMSWWDTIIRGIVGTLRGTIDIDDLYMVAIHTVHLLAATRREADGQVVERVEEQTHHRR